MRAKRVGLAVFLVLVGALLVRAAQSIAWHDVAAALLALDATTVASALALTVASYLLYSCYDLAARRYADHHVATPRVMMISLIAYAFSLNIGALVGGTGFRFRMYAREGVSLGRIARVVLFCIATNWIGYVALASALFASGAIVPPPEFTLLPVGTGTGLRVLGVAMLCAIVAYLIACRATHGRIFHVRGHHFRLPSLQLALLQIAMAAGNWALMGMIVARFLPRTGDAVVLAALLLAAITTAIAHVPAGLGVMEAVFIALLGHATPAPEIIAALLAYRACYYLAPLVLALLAYALLEFRGRPARSTPLR
ncbi:lysylphosphatidylglycerol synthase domain-containing protein [Lysobacter sp. KIS68-7]|uniref:lysylphosphatidylglycerol synthase domain-containing protein n=1 Tax=Lysobacter sp. KIS68-7 TaxID=2904252 RepID=UPI001E3AD8D9|nr:lysylphosphatidylglycerol synthase domain-containing protein [Lysobacter sp. KIS68-7]UHQ18699.1 lysylphosphatidylglycerol synthase domain-containing protein [Lysobacter sp. KIS68-7]